MVGPTDVAQPAADVPQRAYRYSATGSYPSHSRIVVWCATSWSRNSPNSP
jgi:hypothetical protein